MDLLLANKAVLVTGGSTGIGYGVAKAFLAEGAKVAICARDEARLQKAAAELGTPHAVSADLSSARGPGEAVDEAVRQMGRLDVVVSLGASVPGGKVEEFTPEELSDLLQPKPFGYMRLAQAAIKPFRAAGGGVVINVGGTAAVSVPYVYPLGAVASAGLRAFTKTFADEVAELDIRVLGIDPGPVLTSRLEGRFRERAEREELTFEEVLAEVSSKVPLRRLGNPEDIANLAVFLASPRASWLTGDTFLADGGWSRAVR